MIPRVALLLGDTRQVLDDLAKAIEDRHDNANDAIRSSRGDRKCLRNSRRGRSLATRITTLRARCTYAARLQPTRKYSAVLSTEAAR